VGQIKLPKWANSEYRNQLIIETNMKADTVMAKSVFRGATAGLASVVCAGYEFNEHYHRLMEDWEDETKKKPGGKRE
jgi:hypothetical protein